MGWVFASNFTCPAWLELSFVFVRLFFLSISSLVMNNLFLQKDKFLTDDKKKNSKTPV